MNEIEDLDLTPDDIPVSDMGAKEPQEPKGSPKRKKKNWKRRLIAVGVAFGLLVCMYLTVAYSSIPFIEKWRTIYIETAMTTNSHKWLATMFFPKSVVDAVVEKQRLELEQQKGLESKWDEIDSQNAQNDAQSENERKEREFFETYWELDTPAFRDYLDKNPSLTAGGYDHVLVEDFEKNLGLVTKQGDPLLVLDTENDLMIVGVSGEGYQGKLAIVKDPARVAMAKSKSLGSFGQQASGFGEDNDAVLVVNASGFADAGGHGSGGLVKGTLIIDGVEYGNRDIQPYWKFCGMKQDLKMYISNYPEDVQEYRWSVEFFPALIVNGESVVDGTFGMGIQPRATIGQTRRGDMLFLIVDGRQVGYSLGCTVAECTNVMLRYDAYQGMNVDGGSSAVMWYKGEYITKSSSKSGLGRYMPNAFIVK